MGVPIEYRCRMLAEQMVMTDALQFIAQLIIYFAFLAGFQSMTDGWIFPV